MRAHPVGEPDRVLGVVDPDVHVQGEGGLAARQLAHRAVHQLVARAGGDDGLLPHGEGVRGGAGAREAERAQLALQHRAQMQQLGGHLGDVGVDARAQLERGAVGLGRHVGRELLGQRGKHPVDLLRERPVVRAEEHRLLLHAEGELVARETSRPSSRSRHRLQSRTARWTRPPGALNSAAFSGRAVSTSACHCTPSTNGRAGASTPSITPSGDQATARSPPPSRLIAWW